MGKNRLFQEARHFVEIAEEAFASGSKKDKSKAISVAKNALSSAYANSTVAEQKQLREFQDALDKLQ
ncbi:DUF3813 domain-containing protein [Lederbergia graminis]|uniref:DUF3813 domain-containing protein n=1 Tax=Lederbergia graminis TaxID=735518 RepID=A0ABW0LHN7_9BACI|nr:DUF3813 domain-containing protein [Paenibacillus bovis]HLU23677.1 DUF3813 domain-containing protein [Bacillaceae bacterium]